MRPWHNHNGDVDIEGNTTIVQISDGPLRVNSTYMKRKAIKGFRYVRDDPSS